MPRAKPMLPIYSHRNRGRVEVRVSYKTLEHCQPIPGFEHSKGVWLIPEEYLTEPLRSVLPDHPIVDRRTKPTPTIPADWRNAKPHQQAAIEKIRESRSAFLTWEMGLGKTLPALLATYEHRPTLVVCPAQVRENWLYQARRWTEEEPTIIRKGADWQPQDPELVVTSYELVANAHLTRWQSIILDEAHYIANLKARRSKELWFLSRNDPDAMRIALTGTPVPNLPGDLWHQLDFLWPGRFGSFWTFVNRYCAVARSAYGVKPVPGINEEHHDELQARIEPLLNRLTRTDVPAMKQLEINPLHVGTMDEDESWIGARAKTKEMQRRLEKTASGRTRAIVEYVVDAIRSGLPRLAILVYSVDFARHLAQTLSTDREVKKLGRPIHLVTGEDVPDTRKRHGILRLAAESNSILVMSMKSGGVGINLPEFYHVLCAELYYGPNIVEQVFARFARLDSQQDTVIDVMIGSGLELSVCTTLIAKLSAIHDMVRSNLIGNRLQAALENCDNYEEQVLAAARSLRADDYAFGWEK